MVALVSGGAQRRLEAGRRRFSRVINLVLPPLIVGLLLLLLIPVAIGSSSGAIIAVGLVMLLVVLVTFGIEKTATILLGVGFLFAPMNNVHPVAAATFITASDVFLALGVGTLFPILLTRKIDRQAPFLIGAGGIFLAGTLTSLASPAVFASLNGLTRLVVGALLLPLVFMLWQPGRHVMIAFASAYIVGNGISVVDGLRSGLTAGGRYAGLTEHPNILGLVSVLALALTPFLYNDLSRHRWLVIAGAAASASGVWFSGSRAALIAVAGAVVLYLLLSRSIEHALVFFGLAIVPFYFLGQVVTSTEVSDSNPIGRLLGGGGSQYSDIEREGLATTAIDRFLAHPILGSGFDGATLAHNIYLQVAAAGGLVALALYLLVLVSTIRQPLMLGSRYRFLAIPVMAYALIGPLTPLLWDRYIWCVLALPFLIPWTTGDDHEAAAETGAQTGARPTRATGW